MYCQAKKLKISSVVICMARFTDSSYNLFGCCCATVGQNQNVKRLQKELKKQIEGDFFSPISH